MTTIKEDLVDIVGLLRDGPIESNFVPEQELYFDAGYTPPQTTWKICKEEWIDGKLYKVYS